MRYRMLPSLIVSLVFAAGQSIGQEPAVVGSKAPSFKLQDQNGKPIALDELVKDRNIALVFYRSADW